MKYTDNDRAMALAGVFQAAKLVHQISNTGRCSDATFESSLETLFKFDSHSVEDIYGGKAELRTGFTTVIEQMSDLPNKHEMDITRYAVSILHLEKKLKKNHKMLDEISQRLTKMGDQMEYFSLTHENVIANIASLYQDTISNLSPKIMINGEQIHLTQTNNTNKIRAVLLAGIRSAILWRQCGGNRLHFLLGRKKHILLSKQLIESI